METITYYLRKIAAKIAKVNTPFGKKTLNRSFEIPFLAGYSKDGKTVYLDKRLNPELKLKDGRTMDISKYLIVHEATEKHLMDTKDYKYPYAHELATKAEREAVKVDGYPWDEYQKYALAEVQRLKELDPDETIPEDLDVKPEIDTKDYPLLKKIRKQQKI